MKDIIQVQELCSSLPEVTEGFPFDDKTLVFKVMDKIFAVIPLDEDEEQIGLKFDPDLLLKLRSRYDAIAPISYFDNRHWSTVLLQRDISPSLVEQLIKHSYLCVVKKLPKRTLKEKPQMLSIEDAIIEL